MNTLKTILAGVLGGLAIFLLPFFLLRLLAIVILFKLAFRLLGFSRGRMWKERFMNMTDEQKAQFAQQRAYCSHHPFFKTNPIKQQTHE